MNYLITLSYDGSRYHGWQRQENAVSVQQTVEEALSSLFCREITVNGCSRTDTGVHANCFRANFISDKEMKTDNIVTGANFYLPQDIAVKSAVIVPDGFHARFDCVSKEYIYKIYNSPQRSPFFNGYALHYKYPLNDRLLDREARDFLGTHDFSAFRAEGSNVKSSVRTILSAGVEREGDIVTFRVRGDGFLYNMVRIMTGTLLYINEGKIPAGSVPELIESKNRLLTGKTIDACGLYLNDVEYRL